MPIHYVKVYLIHSHTAPYQKSDKAEFLNSIKTAHTNNYPFTVMAAV